MRVFLAGGTGVIGRTLVPLLVEAGHQVAATTRSAQRQQLLRGLGAEPVVVDVFDREALVAAVTAARPDAVVHQLTDLTAGDLADNARLRRDGTDNLVAAARAAGVSRMVAQSIAWVLPPSSSTDAARAQPADETVPLDVEADEPRRTTVLGVQALESAVGSLDHGVVLRYGHLYGPHTMWARDGRYADLVRSGTAPVTDAVVSFVNLQDAARAAVAALDWPGGTYHVIDDEPAALADWLPVYAEAVGAVSVPAAQATGPGRLLSNARLHAQGFELVHPSWREGFATL